MPRHVPVYFTPLEAEVVLYLLGNIWVNYDDDERKTLLGARGEPQRVAAADRATKKVRAALRAHDLRRGQRGRARRAITP